MNKLNVYYHHHIRLINDLSAASITKHKTYTIVYMIKL